MDVLAFIAGLSLIVLVLIDAFETVVLPRQVSSRFRITAQVGRLLWLIGSAPVRDKPSGRNRENYLSIFGPLSLLIFAVCWVIGLTFGFALLFWAIHSPVEVPGLQPGFASDLVASVSAFFFGLGDEKPLTAAARVLILGETGTGLAFLALVIAFLPAVYQAFSEREVHVTMLDARAGSPPTSCELLRRCGQEDYCEAMVEFLKSGEQWSSELLETQLSFPMLGFYRSQHENQSWLAALAVTLDAAALVTMGIDGIQKVNGRLTFAIARHAVVDLAQVYRTPPRVPAQDRLSRGEFELICSEFSEMGIRIRADDHGYEKLAELRALYEPYLISLSEYLLMPIPGWRPDGERPDNWESTAWGGTAHLKL